MAVGLRANVRSALRSAAIDGMALAQAVSGRGRRLGSVPRVQFIYSHHLFEDEVPGFERLIRSLRREYEFVSHSRAVELLRSGMVDRPYAALSFDDGLANMAVAGDILHKMGIPACFFVCPGMVGQTDRATVARWCRSNLNKPPAPLLNWTQIQRLLDQGHEIGSHTHTHVNLGRVSATEAEHELGASREELLRRLGPASARHFAWPFGWFHHMTSAAAAFAYRVGYESCAAAMRGAHGRELAGHARPCLMRDVFVASQRPHRLQALLLRNVGRMDGSGRTWPESWRPAIEGAA
ncbi:MAG: polysaccharide deacetylase family protein [Phycisphaeraceae bacterium]|nr:polysaccharide deacetylase family protein [Phycisphaeraceae bacterium]